MGARRVGGRRRRVRRQVGDLDRPDLDEQRPARLPAHRGPLDAARPGPRLPDLGDRDGLQGAAGARWATGSGSSPPACRRRSATTPSTGRTCSTTAGRTSSPSSSSSRPRTRWRPRRPTTSGRTPRRGSPSPSAGCRTARPTSPATPSPTRSPAARTATTGSATTSSRTTWTRRTTAPATRARSTASTARRPCTSGSPSGTATTRPYNGRDDAPAYDYWSGFPAYDDGDGPTATAFRHTFFDLDTGPLPDHLVEGLLEAMQRRLRRRRAAHPAAGPALLGHRPRHRPARRAAQRRRDGRDVGDRLPLPQDDEQRRDQPAAAAAAVGLHRPLVPDASRRGRLRDRRRPDAAGRTSTTTTRSRLLDLLLALFAWAVYLAQVVVWLATVLPGLILDIATFPAREVIYWAVIVPAWNLYLLARRALVMSGFAMPKPGEINPGLTTLGREGTYDIASALDNPFGIPTAPPPITEPSGRLHPDRRAGARPRLPARDRPRPPLGDRPRRPRRGARVSRTRCATPTTPRVTSSSRRSGWRRGATPSPTRPATAWPRRGRRPTPARTSSGPTPPSCSPAWPATTTTRHELEKADSPARPRRCSTTRLPADQHLGGPVDYGLYLVGRMAERGGPAPSSAVPDFNLDSDRGYAWRTWDWDRGTEPLRPRHHPGRRRGLRLPRCRAPRRSSSTPTTTARPTPAGGTRRTTTSRCTTCPATGPASAGGRDEHDPIHRPDLARAPRPQGGLTDATRPRRPRPDQEHPVLTAEGGRASSAATTRPGRSATPSCPSGDLDPGWTPSDDVKNAAEEPHQGDSAGRAPTAAAEDVYPYLLIRAHSPGDRAVRPTWPSIPCWESPDILLDRRGLHRAVLARRSSSGARPPGRRYRVFVRVWNLGLVPGGRRRTSGRGTSTPASSAATPPTRPTSRSPSAWRWCRSSTTGPSRARCGSSSSTRPGTSRST